MSSFEELLERLNEKEIKQTDCSWYENIPDDIWQEYFTDNNYTILEYNIDVDDHRWYERSTVAVLVEGYVLGINLITKLHSEEMDVTDVGTTVFFFETEAVKSVTYKRRSKGEIK